LGGKKGPTRPRNEKKGNYSAFLTGVRKGRQIDPRRVQKREKPADPIENTGVATGKGGRKKVGGVIVLQTEKGGGRTVPSVVIRVGEKAA